MAQNTGNNIAISAAEYSKISKGYNTQANLTAAVRPAYDLTVRLSTVLADNTHDGLSPLCLKSAMLEDNMLMYTKVLTPPFPLITTIISEVGRCVEFIDPSPTGNPAPQNFTQNIDFEAVTAPYDIPNNNNQCFIRDCFDGTWVPGLNNIFDQAGASLKSFIEYHNVRNGWAPKLINPIKNTQGSYVPGGIGQQLLIKGINHLKYTAYFNYDLLWFHYITSVYLPEVVAFANLRTKAFNAINGNTPPVTPDLLLTPDEIFVINTVNINFLWCRLMIYCYNCVNDDEFFRNNPTYSTGYLSILQKLSQIRFDNFATTADGYISNPYIYYRGSNKTNILKGVYADVLPYIESMCSQIYSPINPFGTVENVALAGGVEYVTSQSMAATCMSQFLKLIFPGRSKATGDAIKIACMNEINKLFNLTGNKIYPGYGWSILKFSGDSSHIVLGEIVEAIKIALGGVLTQIEIIYAISERPLAARLLAASKNVYSAVNSVFSKNFNGLGSANKGLRHAALYIQWDKTKQFDNLVQGLVSKVNEITTLGLTFTSPNVTLPISTTIATVEQLKLLYSFFPYTTTTSDNIDAAAAAANAVVELINLVNTLIQTPGAQAFLTAYSIAKLRVTLDTKITAAISAPFMNLVRELGGGNRGAGHTNWLKGMHAFNMRASMPDAPAIRDEFDSMYEIVNLLVEYNIDRAQTDSTYIARIFAIENFQKIFKKIISAHLNKLLGGKNIEKIESFRQTREEEWRGDSKGNGDIIPGKVDSIIGRMETLLTNCFKIYDNLQSSVPNMMRGGGNSADEDVENSGNVSQTKSSKQIGGDLSGPEIIAAKEQVIDALTNGQFSIKSIFTSFVGDEYYVNYVNRISEYARVGADIRTIFDNINYVIIQVHQHVDVPTKDQLPEFKELLQDIQREVYGYVDSDDKRKALTDLEAALTSINRIGNYLRNLDILPSEYERLYSSLYPFMKSNDYYFNDKSSKSELEFDQIFANRLKNLDISEPNDFAYLYENERQHLSAALSYIKGILQRKYLIKNKPLSGLNYLNNAIIPVIQQIRNHTQPYDFTFVNVVQHLLSLYDMKVDNDIIISSKFNENVHMEIEEQPAIEPAIENRKRKKDKEDNPFDILDEKLEFYFPSLNHNDYSKFLYIISQLFEKNGGGITIDITHDIDGIKKILLERVEVARIISSSGLMEPIFNTLADEEYVANLRVYPRARVNRFLSAVRPHGFVIRGGKKTRRRRHARSPNKTQYKREFDEGVKDNPTTSSTSHKSTRETINRKKTKRSNRPKKNKTRRKRNY